MQFILFNPYIGPLSSASTSGQSGPGSNGNEEVLRIPQSSSITGTSPSDCLVSYPRHSLGEGLTALLRYSRCFQRPQPIGQGTEKEFLFGAWKPIFSCMRGLRFLSDALREIFIFVFILFHVYSILIIYLFFIYLLSNPHITKFYSQRNSGQIHK